MNEPGSMGPASAPGSGGAPHAPGERPGHVDFSAALDRGPIVLDAGMGARLIARGLDPRTDDPCLWNLERPDEVLKVHRRDAEAGARALFANTFGANRPWLSKYGRGDAASVAALNARAVALARRAVGPSGIVIGSIGPSAAGLAGAAAEQAAALVEAGADALVFETFEADALVHVLREVVAAGAGEVPILASLWRWPSSSRALEAAARRLLEAGASVLGVNCEPDLEAVVDLARRLAQTVSVPLLAKPSVRPGPSSSPGPFAAIVPRLLEWNVRFLGGCCGTDEEHVRALAAACAEFHRGAGPRTVPSAQWAPSHPPKTPARNRQ